MMSPRWLLLPPVAFGCLLALAACGGDDGDGGGTTGDSAPEASAETDDGGTGGEVSATVTIDIAGETYEETGGGCTEYDGGEGLAVNVGQPRGTGLGISAGTAPGSQKANSGEDITDATVRFSTDGVGWTAAADEDVVLRIGPGLDSGTFTGTFVAADSGRTELAEGSFTC